MNSPFSALVCTDTLRLIFAKLPVPDLARASCVCRVWNSVVSDKEIVKRAFKAPWKLRDVVGSPNSGTFWRDNGIRKFAISHWIVRGDSIASLAVKYSVQVIDIKRLNNMISDHGIYSRERLLIPISKPDILINETCYIELDVYAKREVAVLYPEGDPDKGLSCSLGKVASEESKRRVIDSLKRSMQVDDGTAQYYLSISNGDPRAALLSSRRTLSGKEQRAYHKLVTYIDNPTLLANNINSEVGKRVGTTWMELDALLHVLWTVVFHGLSLKCFGNLRVRSKKYISHW